MDFLGGSPWNSTGKPLLLIDPSCFFSLLNRCQALTSKVVVHLQRVEPEATSPAMALCSALAGDFQTKLNWFVTSTTELFKTCVHFPSHHLLTLHLSQHTWLDCCRLSMTQFKLQWHWQHTGFWFCCQSSTQLWMHQLLANALSSAFLSWWLSAHVVFVSFSFSCFLAFLSVVLPQWLVIEAIESKQPKTHFLCFGSQLVSCFSQLLCPSQRKEKNVSQFGHCQSCERQNFKHLHCW